MILLNNKQVNTIRISLIILMIISFFVNSFASMNVLLCIMLLFFSLSISSFIFSLLLESLGSSWSAIFTIFKRKSTEVLVFSSISILLLIFILRFFDIPLENNNLRVLFVSGNFYNILVLIFLLIALVITHLQTKKYPALMLILIFFNVTMLLIDLTMSIQRTEQYIWQSTIWGIYLISSGLVASLSIFLFIRTLKFNLESTDKHINFNITKLVWGLNIFWAYIAIVQYLIIWYGGIEMSFYHIRGVNNWEIITYLIILFHFVIPFLLWIPKSNKQNKLLVYIGTIIIFIGFSLEMFWIILPALESDFYYAIIFLPVVILLAISEYSQYDNPNKIK